MDAHRQVFQRFAEVLRAGSIGAPGAQGSLAQGDRGTANNPLSLAQAHSRLMAGDPGSVTSTSARRDGRA